MAHIECSICLDHLSAKVEEKQPYVLTCGHSFCCECTKNMVIGDMIECPICRTKTLLGERGFLNIKKNFMLIHVLEMHDELLQQTSNASHKVPFTECEGFTNTMCVSCRNSPPICSSCFALTHGTQNRRSHKLVACTNAGEGFCSEHQEPYKLFCTTDKTLVCLMCAHYGSHKEHKVELLSDAVSAIKPIVSHYSSQIEQQLLQVRQEEMTLQCKKISLEKASKEFKECLQEKNEIKFLSSWSKCKIPPREILKEEYFDTENCYKAAICDDGRSFRQIEEASSNAFGFVYGCTAISNGIYRCSFVVNNDITQSESVCIGIARQPLTKDNYTTNKDCWVLRAFNGEFYNQGKRCATINGKYTVGDRVTIEVNMNEGTLIYFINDIMVENINCTGITGTVYPIVLFYGSNFIDVSIGYE